MTTTTRTRNAATSNRYNDKGRNSNSSRNDRGYRLGGEGGGGRHDEMDDDVTRRHLYRGGDDFDNDNDDHNESENEDDEEEIERRLSERHGEAAVVASSDARKRTRQETDGEIAEAFARATRRKRPPAFSVQDMMDGTKGVVKILHEFPQRVKYKRRRRGPNAASVHDKHAMEKYAERQAAAEYARSLISSYRSFCTELSNNTLAMEDVLQRLEVLGAKREFRNYLQQMRDDVRRRHMESILGKERTERMLREYQLGMSSSSSDAAPPNFSDDADVESQRTPTASRVHSSPSVTDNVQVNAQEENDEDEEAEFQLDTNENDNGDILTNKEDQQKQEHGATEEQHSNFPMELENVLENHGDGLQEPSGRVHALEVAEDKARESSEEESDKLDSTQPPQNQQNTKLHDDSCAGDQKSTGTADNVQESSTTDCCRDPVDIEDPALASNENTNGVNLPTLALASKNAVQSNNVELQDSGCNAKPMEVENNDTLNGVALKPEKGEVPSGNSCELQGTERSEDAETKKQLDVKTVMKENVNKEGCFNVEKSNCAGARSNQPITMEQRHAASHQDLQNANQGVSPTDSAMEFATQPPEASAKSNVTGRRSPQHCTNVVAQTSPNSKAASLEERDAAAGLSLLMELSPTKETAATVEVSTRTQDSEALTLDEFHTGTSEWEITETGE